MLEKSVGCSGMVDVTSFSGGITAADVFGAFFVAISLSEVEVEMATISTSSTAPVERRSCSYVANS